MGNDALNLIKLFVLRWKFSMYPHNTTYTPARIVFILIESTDAIIRSNYFDQIENDEGKTN